MMKSIRDPTSPPTSAAMTISQAHSEGLPSSLSRRATTAPAAANPSANMIPKV
jgi:hypothetical protein